MWSKEEGWRQSLRAYLKSGGYQKVVNRESIRQLPQRTLVLWGEEDDVLPVEDAYKYDAPVAPTRLAHALIGACARRYQEDLPNCVGVDMIPNAQHAPALENPDYVAKRVIEFTTSVREGRRAELGLQQTA